MTMPPANPPDATPTRILVVDDEEIVLVALRDLLRQQGYEVSTASSALEALELVKRQSFAVVLTDQQMPTLTGLEFLAEAKQTQPDASRILITAVLSLGTVIDAINKAEVYRFILKPWQREDLLATVQLAVERYEGICRDKALLAGALAKNEELARLNAELQKKLAPARQKKSRAPA
jgi:DNA-binding NtrC family response regulator